MSFVFPVLLGGISLTAIPILIHFIRQQKPRTVRFPAMRFLVKNHKTANRKRRLRHLLLLLLRMALLLVICLAVAQPKLLSDQFNLTTDQPVAAVFVIDTSYSMEYKTTGGQSRLQDAKKRALKLLEKLPSRSRVAILDTGIATGDHQKAWSNSREEAEKAIRRLRLRHVNNPVTTQLVDAIAVFQELEKPTFPDPLAGQLPRLLCVFSDATGGSWESAQTKRILTKAKELAPQFSQFERFARSIPDQIKLLDQLPKKLPEKPGENSTQQPLIELLNKLDAKIADASEATYPQPQTQQIIADILTRNRLLTEQIRNHSTDELDDTAKRYREDLLASLDGARKDLSGYFGLFVNVGVSQPIDLAMTSIRFPSSGIATTGQQLFHPKDRVIIRVSIRATGKPISSVVLCKIDGKLLKQKRSVTVPPGSEQQIHFPIDCSKLAPGFHRGEVYLGSGDALDFNNRRLFTFAIRKPRRILIITDDVPSGGLWARAIESKSESLFNTSRVTPTKAEEFTAAEMRKYEAIYLFNVRNPSQKLWASLNGYVSQGGNIAIVPAGKQLNKDAYNRNQTAKELMPGRLLSVEMAPENGLALKWTPGVFQHPLFQPFLGWQRSGVGFFDQTPRTVQYYWEVEPYKTSLVLIKYDHKIGHPAILERSAKGRGTVVLLTTRLNTGQEPKWNNYMEFTTYFPVVLPVELTEYLTGRVERQDFNYLLGRNQPQLRIPFGITDKLFQLRGPGGDQSVPRPDGQTILRFGGFALPGNYALQTKEEEIGGFTLNMPASESILDPIPKEEIEYILGRGSVVSLDHDEDLLEELKKGHLTEPIPLFPYLMIGLLVLLALENLLSNLFHRSRNPQPQT
ncbi:MAG: BatA domain-containing protein [Gemmataceae bacterium]